MNNKLLLLTFGILLISLTSAIDIYAGETINLELEKPFAYYSIVGNSSPVYLDIIQNGNNVQITFNKYMKDDSFELVFFDIEKETITIYQSSGGGGGTRTITKYVNNTIEVPNYLTEYNEIIKVVDNKTTEEVPLEKKGYYIWLGLGIGILFSLIILFIAIKIFIPHREKENL